MRWSTHVTDTFFAPELSKFTAALIPDMSEVDAEQQHWLTNYLLNSVLRGRLRTPARQQVYNFLRRAQSAFADYELARVRTEEFLADRDNRLRSYVGAVGHWEDFLSHVWQANTFLTSGLTPDEKRPLFQPGDGTVNERLHSLHTRSKHAAEAIARGDYISESPLCVWLTNEGLKSTDSWLTFEEAADELRSLTRWAEVVADPVTLADKIAAMAEDKSTG